MTMDMQAAIRAVTERQDLSAEDMTAVMRIIMNGEATPAQIGGFLIGLRMKGETVEEIAAAAPVMRELATHVEVPTEHLVDTCGNGGDGAHTFNISTTAAFVVAAAGGRVAKHGNRSASSSSGGADLLEAAGVNLDLDTAGVVRCIEQAGVGFLFAPRHHSAMRHAIGPRREMAVRTVFNLLGPMTNPAGALHQLVGVFARQWVEPVAEVFARLGSRHVLVVHADDGLDELSIAAPSTVAEMRDGKVKSYQVTPEHFGLERAPLDSLKVGSPAESLAIVRRVLDGEPGPAFDIVALNAGAALYAADLSASLVEGVTRARRHLADGSARERLETLVRVSQQS